MRPPRQPLYLARQSYRRRRLMDAARLLPLLGLFLFALPLLWPKDPDTPDVALEAIYLFGVWSMLVAAALVLSTRLVDTVTGGVDEPMAQPPAAPGVETGGNGPDPDPDPDPDIEGPR